MSSDNEVPRRDVLRTLGISLTLTASGADVITAEAAQHVHQMVKDDKAAAAKGPYKPKAFTAHEYATLRRLAELIVPGALEAGAPEFIDYLSGASDEMKEIYTGGIGWLDHEMQRRYRATFVTAKAADQTAMLDLIAYSRNESPELGAGIRFFTWARNMVVDAFYTSKIGMAELGFMGNGAMTTFTVPVEAIQYAVKRSGL